ncbi:MULTISPECIES: NAD-dependent epimerase/dehydratase family protein [Halobacterium]|uniref:NAD-dependent epimerase/dehydratase family protein n=1 Tax=Halobacterium TaxID=2239 RepID=UPI00073E1783|nr:MULTISPECIES: NAD-dependent epimerase/dehydratase family protein [Halobacterium]MCG1002337.1 NAD-dependent epimerase/dehydratase family protein [Halobacterium noricense]
MDSALVVGGTRFIGRHLVEELLAHDYRVTTFNRGQHDDPFAEDDRVHHVQGDRTDRKALLTAKREVEPDAVFDCVAYKPREVENAIDIFAGVDAYVYVSSGAAYADEDVPKREDETELERCTAEQATDDSPETYGPRKAAGDRIVFEAAERSRQTTSDGLSERSSDNGVNAMSVRPPVVYGPHDYTERLAYWVDRVAEQDEVVVPGDGTNLWQRVFVEDVARGLRLVAEEGTPGEAYNVGDRNAVTLDRTLDLIADALGTDVERAYTSPRELSIVDLDLGDFPLYRDYPHLLDTSKVEALGFESTPVEEAMEKTVDAHRENGLAGPDEAPDREDEERLLDVLGTV